ncbi:MAG TPA: acyl-CoA dehydrogenase [Acidimicrobiia bacterium]|jgi:alkylation response protein AidB-like acyl-CoA dehydrogenase|nr:acyl-CoA dehydrogenase [Acidimicrobiia bacterium]
MTPYRAPLSDIEFVLKELCDLEGLARLEPFAHAEPAVVADLLAEAGRFAAEVVAPTNQPGDQAGCVRHPDGSVTTPPGFKEAYRAYVDAGWGSVAFDPTYGGGGFPWLVGTALAELNGSANLAWSMAPGLSQGAIHLIERHGTEAQRQRYLPKLVSGEWTGTMNLTEPDAGSDVGALRTRAVPRDDGTWLITGTKIFISFGEHDMAGNIVHLVLARTPGAPAGAKGISCFVVPKYLVDDDGNLGARNDVTCLSIEHKLGIKGSPTCVLAFGESDGAVGELIGEEHRGLEAMFTMMNQARLAVGLQGLAAAERSYQQALAYARERRQGRAPGAPAGESSPIVDHPDVRRTLLTMKAQIDAMRRLVYWNAGAIDRSLHHPDPETKDEWTEIAALLTPLTKAWCTDTGIDVTSLGIQVHGGVGYIEETGAAQHLRDARITSIYEGTNGIQAIDLVGRKLPLRGGAVVKDHLERIAALDAELAEAGEEMAGIRSELREAHAALVEATLWLASAAGSPADVLAGATPYLRLFAMVTAGWLMARSALAAQARLKGAAAGGADEAFLRSKVTTARFFCEQLLPPAVGLLASVTAGAEPLFAIDPETLGAR